MFCLCGQSHNPVHCIVPPHLIQRLSESSDKELRDLAFSAGIMSSALRAVRAEIEIPRAGILNLSAPAVLSREVYTMGGSASRYKLPGTRARFEGDAATGDNSVDEAYDHSGTTWNFFHSILGRNSIDNAGMTLVSSVHYGNKYMNAFWDGRQMTYGDGDGRIFGRFTRSLDVVAHEMAHGITSYECDLIYQDESGALNEHFSDVFGSLVKQWALGQDAAAADWLIGADLIIPTATRRALRSMSAPGTAHFNDPDLGDDPQPDHYSRRYTGSSDNGGVHINSGIPNKAFYLAATSIGGNSWEKAGRIWFDALRSLTSTSVFVDAKRETISAARNHHGVGSTEENSVREAWTAVGV